MIDGVIMMMIMQMMMWPMFIIISYIRERADMSEYDAYIMLYV